MMASFMSYFGGRRDPKQSSREAIVTLRQQLQMIEKKEEFLQKKIDSELQTAKQNAVTNKNVATAALKRKKVTELELERLQGTRFQLEMHINTLESASFNAETMTAIQTASKALKAIHSGWTVERVDNTIAELQEETTIAQEVAEAISANTYANVDINDEALMAELNELEQDELNERLAGAEHVPLHQPAGTSKVEDKRKLDEEDEEARQLKELQAALTM